MVIKHAMTHLKAPCTFLSLMNCFLVCFVYKCCMWRPWYLDNVTSCTINAKNVNGLLQKFGAHPYRRHWNPKTYTFSSRNSKKMNHTFLVARIKKTWKFKKKKKKRKEMWSFSVKKMGIPFLFFFFFFFTFYCFDINKVRIPKLSYNF